MSGIIPSRLGVLIGWWLLIAFTAIVIILAEFSLAGSCARAGTCHNYSDGGHTVQSCDNGSFTVYHRRHQEQYGHRNGGFERYPAQGYDVPTYQRY